MPSLPYSWPRVLSMHACPPHLYGLPGLCTPEDFLNSSLQDLQKQIELRANKENVARESSPPGASLALYIWLGTSAPDSSFEAAMEVSEVDHAAVLDVRTISLTSGYSVKGIRVSSGSVFCKSC